MRWLRSFLHRDRLARAGEDLAARHLEARGYRARARRLRTPHGEIDLVAELGETVVFVEVKTRRSEEFAAPAEAVVGVKSERLRRAALWCLQHDPELAGRPSRIDVIEVIWPESGTTRLRHLEDAVDRGRY